MDENLPAVLLMGGGEGMGPIEATARALGDALYDENLGEPVGQVLVICGRNKKLASKLLSIDWKVPVQVLTYLPQPSLRLGFSLPIKIHIVYAWRFNFRWCLEATSMRDLMH